MTIICILLSNHLVVLLCVLLTVLSVIMVLMSLHHIKAQLLCIIRVWPLKFGHSKQEWSLCLQLSHFYSFSLMVYYSLVKKKHLPFRNTLMGGCPVQYCTSRPFIICLNLRLKTLHFCLTCFSNFIYIAIFTKITLYCKSCMYCLLIDKWI